MGALGVFALALAVAGGLIAWLGDRLGTYIGKRRLTNFGLRPRHTAMLWTICSGAGIALLTLFVLFFFAQGVRRALQDGPQIIRANAVLSRQNKDLLRQNRGLQWQTSLDETRWRQTGQQLQRSRNDLEATRSSFRQAQGRLKQSQAALRRQQAALGQAQQQLAAARGDLGHTQAALAQAHVNLGTARRQVAAARSELRQAGTDYVKAQRTVARLVIEGDRLHTRNDDLAARNVELTRQNRQQVEENNALLGANLIYHKGQEIGRRVIATDLPSGMIRNAISGFLEDLGAATNSRTAVLAAPPSSPGVVPAGVTQKDMLDALAGSIAGQAGVVPGVVLVAEARYNTFWGEQALVNVHLYDNSLVYARGAVVAVSPPIDGTQTDDLILASLQAFLTQRVRPAALHHGIIPQRDPQTGEPSVGAPIASATWLALVKQIHQAGAAAVVIARAGEDAYSAGPLRLSLSVAGGLPPAAHASASAASTLVAPAEPSPGGR